MGLVQGISRWRDHWDRFEAAVGLIAAFVLAFGPLTAATFTLIFSVILAEWSVAGVAALITAVTCPMALWLTRMAESALKQFRSASMPFDPSEPPRRIPFAIYLASELPELPRIARAPLAVWWLAHFAAGTAVVLFVDVLVKDGLLWDGLADWAAEVAFGYLFHFAANVYLVLAVTACFGSSKVTAGVWRWRFVIDAMFMGPILVRNLL